MSAYPRVLLSAYQCAPGEGLESELGWQWYRRLAARTSTTLVTHVRNREALEDAGSPSTGSDVVYVDTERFAGPWYGKVSEMFQNSDRAQAFLRMLDFYVYDHAMVRGLEERRNDWDVVHAVTPASPLAATQLHKLDLPLVLGPWNGGLTVPSNLRKTTRNHVSWLPPLRHFAKLYDGIIGSTRNADVVLSATRATTKSIAARYRERCVRMLDNGVDLTVFEAKAWPEAPSADNPLRVCFVGSLIPEKAVNLLLHAVQRMREKFPIEAHIVGDGPLRAELERCAHDLRVNDIVTFHGTLPPAGVAGQLQAAHLTCLPSVRESSGAVVLETMACARPSVVVNHGGRSELVKFDVGVDLRPKSEETIVAGLCKTFVDVVRRPHIWRERGETARRRAERHYSWDYKISAALGVYLGLRRRRTAPGFVRLSRA